MPEEKRSLSVSLPAFCVRIASFVCPLAAAVFVLFLNPINWKVYTEFTKSDWIWLCFSNLAIVALFSAVWWFGQRSVVRFIDGKKAEPGATANGRNRPWLI